MMGKRKNTVVWLSAALFTIFLVMSMTGCSGKKDKVFTPRLDRETKVVLDVMGFFSNFEALDQVTNDFNEIYPNVVFNYEQVGGENLVSYLEANPGVDIFMTSDEILDSEDGVLAGKCADLSKEDIRLDAIDEDMLNSYSYDGKLLSIPMSQNLYGIVVNVTLLEKEGLSVPQNYSEFLNALDVLKNKGYVPIQGPSSKVYSELTINMILNIIGNDDELYNMLSAGDISASKKLEPVFDILDLFKEKGYFDLELNDTYPNDNYDGAIMKFFEGDVPFWICNTEKVSGMKKRETKSEAFKTEPFEYTYIFAPLGENGSYVYREPWFGFAVSKESDAYEYAVEFIRFLATRDEINKLAEIKGVPSAAVEHNDIEIYNNMFEVSKVESSLVKNEKITSQLMKAWYTCSYKYISGQYAGQKEAIEDFISKSGK